MNRLGVALFLATVIPSVAAVGFWFCVSWLVSSPKREGVRRVGSSLVFLLGGAAAFLTIRSATAAGDRICIICGKFAYTVTVFDRSFERGEPRDALFGNHVESEYAKDFADLIGSHKHCWHPTDYRSCEGREVAERLGVPDDWFRFLPRVNDRELARAYVTKLGTCSKADRLEFIRSFENRLQLVGVGVFDSYFRRWRSGWRTTHPDWP